MTNTKKPSIKQLEYFVSVARASNFRKAAERLEVTQPTLTLQIADMEELLGVKLFDRSRAGTAREGHHHPCRRSFLQHTGAKEVFEIKYHRAAANSRGGFVFLTYPSRSGDPLQRG